MYDLVLTDTKTGVVQCASVGSSVSSKFQVCSALCARSVDILLYVNYQWSPGLFNRCLVGLSLPSVKLRPFSLSLAIITGRAGNCFLRATEAPDTRTGWISETTVGSYRKRNITLKSTTMTLTTTEPSSATHSA
jgi:hypothetical protein